MGLRNYIGQKQPIKKTGKQTKINFPKDNLTSEEIALILGTIRNATFKGVDIEILHSLTLKLQNQFINLEKE